MAIGESCSGRRMSEARPAASRTEERLAAIWCEVLERPGFEGDFFVAGGDSLKAMQILSRIQDVFGVELPLDDLFSTPTVAGLAAHLDGLAAAASAPAAMPPIVRRASEGPAPLSFAQRRLWFLHRLDPENPVHNIAAAVRLSGRLDEAALAWALGAIVARHEALRTTFGTTFESRGDEPLQEAAAAVALALPVIDLAALPEARRWPEARRRTAEIARLPFALERGPFLRAALVTAGAASRELALVWHHIAADGWSLRVFLYELAALYSARREGRPDPLPGLPLQYADFAAWQRGWLCGEALAEHLGFWRERLAGELPILDLPADRPRAAALSHRGAHHESRLALPALAPLLAIAQQSGATPFMALLAGFAALLGRMTGRTDLLLGTPIAGRPRRELEGLIGVFINNLVLRLDLRGDPSYRELLARARETALAAYAHQDLPFEALVEALGIVRDPSRTPIVQVLFAEQSAPLTRVDLPGLRLEPREIDLGTARFDLALSMAAVEEGWLGTWKYSTDLFDAPTPARWAGQLATLLAAAAASPDLPISRLAWLSAGERHQVVLAWNDTATDYPVRDGLHQLIEDQVERTPDAVAVSFAEAALSYRELDRQAGRLAAHLRHLGAGAESLVGIATERSLELMVALVATLKAGAAYVPLDPAYPLERRRTMLADAGIAILVTMSPESQSAGEPALAAGGIRAVFLDRPEEWISEGPSRGSAWVHPQSPAYAIYTSGSTGRPKGVLVPHRGIVNRLLWMQEAYGLGADDRVLQKTPIGFDVSVWELFWPLIAGARLVMAPPGAHQDAAWLARIIRESEITTLHFVPSMLQLFLEGRDVAAAGRSLRRVIASGEALPRALAARAGERLGAPLFNLYGPTEASVDVSWHRGERAGSSTIPIGRPIANLALSLLDGEGEPVPIGVPGELHIGGVGLARGYIGRPDLTAERFVPAGSGAPGERLYRTGDLARFLTDGAIEFLGRLDHQVKIRGVRIELGEVEAALVSHPEVREAVALARTDGGGDPRLVAYLVVAGSLPDAAELRAFLRQSLPDAMVPSAFVGLPALPLTASGKVDRRALPAPEEGESAAGRAFIAPRTPLEERLAETWRQLLGRGRVGIDDNFFELGGDSIQGAMFINRLQEELGQIVYVMALFDAPTVAELAAYLEQSYPAAVARLAGVGPTTADPEAPETGTAPVDLREGLAALRAAVVRRLGRRLGRDERAPEEPAARRGARNPRAIFVLSPFRSGSTLFRVMLAGHPRLFAPPELELLAFGSMGERARALTGRNSFAEEGLLRAVMELTGGDAAAARVWVARFAEREAPVAEVYRELQAAAGGRLLVDKTPSYPLDLETLRQAEALFDEPLYLHLVRHPRAVIDSYVEARMERVYDFPYAGVEQAELVWLLSQQNILAALSDVPAERVHRLRFEDLVTSPRESLSAVCAFLGLPFEPAMAEPYEGRRMTDGIHAESRMMGDPKFHRHRRVEAEVAARSRGAGSPLRAETAELAASFGYDLPAAMAPALGRRAAAGEAGEAPLSFPEERLWFLAQLDPESPAYNLPAAVLLTGALDVPALARSFAEVARRHEVLRSTFPAVEGRPVQRVAPPAPIWPLPVVDLRGLSSARRDAERHRLALAAGKRPFDLAAGPLLRTALLQLDVDEHLLLVGLHHIVADGWAIGILVRELAAIYPELAAGRPSPLPELAIQYADFAAWQRRALDETAMGEHLKYWRRRLSGTLPPLELPTDRPRPSVPTMRGARLSRTLPAADLAELRAAGVRSGKTLFLILLAAFDVLLARHTGQDDLLLGIPIANRNRRELEGLIGVFLNMVVARADAAGDPPFADLFARVASDFLGSIPHQEVPFERLVAELRPERDLSRAPIFQVQFSLQNTPPAPLALPGLTLTLLEEHNQTTKFDLTVFLFDLPEGLTTTLEYSRDLFDESTMDRLLGHWDALLRGVAADASPRLSELPLLTAPERALLLTSWNGPAAERRSEESLHGRFAAQAARRPGATAVVHDLETLTYRQLNERANQLARRLRGLGVTTDTPVVLAVERSLDMIVGILGILKAGGAYVPLDPAYPQERLAWILEDALRGVAAAVLVTTAPLLERFQAPAATGEASAHRVVLLDADRAALAAESVHDLTDLPDLPGAGGESLAYVIYTSGSTGRPKGVLVSHASAVRLFTATERWFGFGADDIWTVFHSFAFDFSVWEIWGALVYGGQLVIVPREVSRSPQAFYELLSSERVTVLNQTPLAFRQLVHLEAEEGERPLRLRWVIFGGEALDPTMLRPWIARHGTARPALVNMYGITETTVHVSFRPLAGEDAARPGGSPLGVPIPDLQIHLLGRHGELQPVGVPGEIHVGGAGLARGYLGRPDLTAERFVPDPFSALPGARLYRSGDLARRRPDGDLDYLGRLDGQVKVRGFRIELGEIEAAIGRHPGVRESAVLVREAAAGDRRLVAWVVPRGVVVPAMPAVTAEELREHLRQILPDYMVPADFVSLDQMPLTAHGKLDRRALPEPDAAAAAGARRGGTAPRNAVEARLAAIWRQVLRIEEVAVEDNFFELGGHSLLVMQLSSRVRAAFGVEMPVRAIFEAATLAALAERLAVLLPTGAAAGEAPIPRLARGGDFPLSFAQERLWFLAQLDPGAASYNIWADLRLAGDLDVPLLQAAFAALVDRHEALRTGFVAVDGLPRQVIAPRLRPPLSAVDLRAVSAPRREAAALALLARAARRPFDLARGPLVRMLLVRLADADWRLLLDLHHIVSDGWSNDVLLRELGVLYAAFAAGRQSPLAELPIQYADFAVWQRGAQRAEALAAEAAYWRGRLAGAPPLLELPADRPRPAVQRGRGGDLRRAIAAELRRDLAARCRGRGATLFMGLVAGLAALLARHAGRDDVLIGTPVSGRNRVEIEGLAGVFINNLVLRTDLSGDPSFTAALGRAREVVLDAFACQELPFEKLVEELAPERSTSHAPIVQVLFALQNPAAGGLALPGIEVSPLRLVETTAKVDLTLNAQEVAGALRLRWVYDRDLFDAATIARLADGFDRLLAAAAAEPERPIAELPLLGAAEIHQTVVEWSDAGAACDDEDAEVSIARLISRQAARHPERTALSAGERSLSYGELDRLSGLLARRLRELGVGPDARVGVCAGRTVEMVVGLLAILKAGGAYVPLDPAYPAARLAFLFADSSLSVLLTEEALSARLPAHGAREVWLDGVGELGGEPLAGVAVDGDSLAYVIYTSGSTGVPKGVGLPQRALANLLRSLGERPGLGAGDVLLALTTISFDIAAVELFLPLLRGARVVLAGREAALDARQLTALLARSQATVLQATPATWQLLTADGEADLRLVQAMTGGEALAVELAARLVERSRSVWNLYGPTETTVYSVFDEVATPPRAGTIPIGRPLANTRLAVVDGAGRPVPLGVAGELQIGGAGLARGYLGRPELTAERFVPDGLTGAPGARLYRTGDLCRALPDGRLEYLGRLDRQVKVRGFRVEPGEVETALAACAGVLAAAVVVRERSAADRALVACVVAGEPRPSAAELRGALAAKLPAHMVPAAFVFLPTLPRTPSGKVDRQALSVLEPGSGTGGEAPERPLTPLEELLAGIFAEVLGVERVGAQESFFELGGHSLSAMQVVARLRTALGVDVPVRTLFAAPAAAGLAAAVERQLGAGSAGLLPPIERASRERPLPLSFAQQRLWFLDQLEPGGHAYNLAGALRLAGRLDGDALADALAEVVRRHEALRTSFAQAGDQPVQVVGPPPTLLLPRVDLSALPEAARAAALRRLGRAWARRPFDLARGPLLRMVLVRLAAAAHQALFAMHHSVSDGWSMGVFAREVAALYAARVSGRAPTPDALRRELPALPVQYGDYAVWQRQWLAGERRERQLAHWRAHLAGAPEALELPTDRPRPPRPSHRGASSRRPLSCGAAASVAALGRRLHATPFMVLLAAYGALLSRAGGSRDLVVGTPIANRRRVELEPLIGLFVNTLALRLDLAAAPSFAALVEQARRSALEGYAHQDLPFEMLVEALRPERHLSRSPIFQVSLVLQNTPAAPVELPGLLLSTAEVDSGRAAADLSLFIVPEGRSYALRLEHARDLFDATTARRLLDRFDLLLAGAGAAADEPLAELPMLAAAERHQLVCEWNDGAGAEAEAASLHQLFAAAAARRPDAVAVLCGGAALSFAALGRCAGRIARRLRRSGVGPEVRVAIACRRSLDMAAAVLGVLAAGGAYVPLDPELPPARRTAMLADSGAAVLLTQAPLGLGVIAAGFDADFAGETILLDGEPLAEPRSSDSAAAVAGDHLAYVVYTSGSTGRPKGVLGTHGGAATYLRAVREAFALRADDRVLQIASLSFDASVRDLLGPLLAGAAVVLVDDARAKDPAALLEEIERQRITCLLSVVPSLLRLLLDEAEVGRSAAPSSLRLILASGERLLAEDCARARRAFGPGVLVVNQYGPTECTMTSGYHRAGPEAGRGGEIPIGRPLPHRSFHVVQDGALAPLAAAGELLIGGGGLSRGYLGQPERTAAAFRPDPFGGAAGGRLYVTGDRVRRRADGTLEFLGRLDDQVKLRGFRVELGEVETALRDHPAVGRAAVVARGEGAGQQLVAYWVAAGDEAPGERQLRAFVGSRLPDTMVPAAFVRLAALPLLANGKVDRRALAARAVERPDEPLLAPRNPLEELIAAVWADVLGRERVDVEESFFDLGGHSLLATQAVSRLRAALGIDLPLRHLFEAPTVARLAAVVAAERAGAGAGSGAPRPPLVRVAATGPAPLSFAQERLWFLDRLEPGSSFYNVPLALRLSGHLKVPLIAACLAEIVRRHQVLRTTFAVAAGQPVQTVSPAAAWAPALVDLSALAPGLGEAAARALAAAEAAGPFDLERGPLVRGALLRLGREEHLALLTLHHVVTDAWSLGVLVAELGALYRAGAAGAPSPLAELPIQYADFARWQRSWLAGEELDRQLAFWRQRLSGAPAALDLPTDRPRPPVQRYRGAERPFALGTGVSAGLAHLARRRSATLFMALLAGFEALLARLSGQRDLVVGAAIANRNHAEIEGLIGFFVNTLALRAEVADDASFAALLGRARKAALGAYDHQDLPFEKLVAELGLPRDPSRSPVFQVVLQLQNAPLERLSLPGLELAPVQLPAQTAKFDLVLNLFERDGEIAGTLRFNTDLFDATTAERLLGQYARLLAGAVSSPETAVSALPLLSAAERHQMLREWGSAGAVVVGEAPTLAHLLARRAAERPDAVAVAMGEGQLTYGELAARAGRLAGQLARAGAGRGLRVGLLAERSLEMVVGIAGILWSGAAYVPLDPEHPAERLRFALADAGVAALVAGGDLGAELAGEIRRLRLEDCLGASEPRAPLPPLPDARPEETAYVIYTSGSTGRPKGVAVTHGNVLALLAGTAADFGFGCMDVWTLFHSYAFDFSVWELWGALGHGGRLVVVPFWVSRSPEAFHELLGREQVTVLNQTPSAFQQLMRADRASDPGDPAGSLRALRGVVFGGERLELSSLAPWWERHGEERPRLVNMYGITETTVHVTYRRLRAADATAGNIGSRIGRPIGGLDLYLLDASLEPVALGTPGEIVVGGSGVSMGYLGRPELTAERFVPDGFGGLPGARLYRSGDLARHRPDGDLEVLGRIDRQVKVRGFRIELGEVEAALRRQAEVRDAAVWVQGERPEDRGLVACVVPAGEVSSLDLGALRSSLAASLPAYLVPSRLVALPALPLTANGKLDREALASAAESETGIESAAWAPPETGLEVFLAELFGEALGQSLGRRRIGLDDDFFALGGNSIAGAVLINRLQEELGEVVHVVAIFNAPSVRRLAAHLVAERAAAVARRWPAGAAAPSAPSERGTGGLARIAPGAARPGEPLPLSFAQERLWFLDQLDPGNPTYNIPLALDLGGRLDVRALAASFAEIVRRHAVLRTTFQTVEGTPRQVIAPALAIPLAIVDLAALAPQAAAAAGRRLARGEALRPFDLARGPLVRTALLRLAPERHVVLATLHHIVADGWSLGVLTAELGALYPAASAGDPSPLPELPVQYGDYAVWQRRWLTEEALASDLAYWRQRLAGAAALDLPTDRPRPPVQSFRGGLVPFAIEGALLDGLRELARRQGATLFMALLAAMEALLARCTGQEDVSVGTPVAGRTRRETEPLIGFFVNTLVLRLDLAGGPDFGALLRRVREAALGGYAHQDLPFERLVEALAPARSLAVSPLFQVLVALQSAPALPRWAGEGGLALAALAPRASVDGTAKFDLQLMLGEQPGRVAGSLEYAADLFERTTAIRLGAALRRLLAAAVAEPERPLAELPLLGAAEIHQTVVEWSDAGAVCDDEDAEVSIARLISRQAASHPERTALSAGERSLSYGELDRLSGLLARRLRELGVGPDARVGVCAGRTLEMVVGLLAILKAGGAYVPLDPAYPAARLAFLFADSDLSVLLTEEALSARLPAHRAREVWLDGVGELGGEPLAAVAVDGDSLAYVIYTSGSTGVPKGVGLPQRALANLLRSLGERPGLGAGDVLLAVTTISFDIAAVDLFLPLLRGARVVLAGREAAMDARQLAALLARSQATVLQATPATWQLLTADGEADLRLVQAMTGGEALAVELAARLVERSRSVWNLYGPTETTVYSVFDEVATPLRAGTIPIGRPLANTRLAVVDGAGRPVPLGVAGELQIGGAGLARGYLGRPELTAERFVPDASHGGARRAALPHRRPLPRAAGRSAGVPRPARPPGQGAGFPHRAGRGGDGARRLRGGAGVGGGAAGEERGGPRSRRLRGGGRAAAVGGGAARRAGGEAAGPHGARGLRLSAGAAADAERQGGPPGVERPRAGLGDRWTDAGDAGGGGEAAQPARRAAGGDLRRGAGGRAGGRPRELLRARRALASRDAGGLPPARRPRRRSAAAAPLRGAERRPARRRCRRGARRCGRLCRRRAAASAEAGGRARPGAALLRPGAALVPRSARAGRRLVQRAAGAPPLRPAEGAAPRRLPRRDRPPSPGAPHHLRGRRGPARPGGLPGRGLGAGSRRSLRARRRPRRGGGARSRRGRGGPPLRPGARAAGARRAPPPGSGGAPGAPHPAPRRHRRLVARRAGGRARGALQGRRRRRSLAACRAADPVRRLRALAALLAGGRGARPPARLLAPAALRRPRGARPADGPAAATGAALSWRGAAVRPRHRGVGGARASRAAPLRHPLHGAPRRLRSAPRAALRPARPGRRGGDRQPQPGRDRGADRLLRQHPGAARRAGGRCELRGAPLAGAGGGARRLRPPGPAVREAGRRAGSAARSVALAGVPGGPAAAERAARAAVAAGARAGAGAAPGADRQVRPRAQPLRAGRGDRRDPALQHRPLRRDDGRAPARAVRAAARRGRVIPRDRGVGAAAPLGGGAPPDAPRVGLGGGGRGGRGADARPSPRPPRGGAAGCGGGRDGGGAAHLRRARGAGRPARRPARKGRRGARLAGWPPRRAVARDGGGDRRDPLVGRGLRAARPGAPGRAAALRSRRRRRGGAGGGRRPRGGAGGGDPAAAVGGLSGSQRAAGAASAASGCPAGGDGLRDLHLGLDGAAEGRRGDARQRPRPARGHGGRLRLRVR